MGTLGNVLDLILTSEIDGVGQVHVLDPFPSDDHSHTMFEYIFSGQSYVSNIPQEPHKAWDRDNYELLEIDWDLELAYLSANQSFDILSAILNQLVNMCIPQKPSQKQELRLPGAEYGKFRSTMLDALHADVPSLAHPYTEPGAQL